MLSDILTILHLSLDKLFIYSLLFYLTYIIYVHYYPTDEPPMVPYIPILGHTLQLKAQPREFLSQCRQRYGDIFSIHFLGKKVTVFSPAAMQHLTKAIDMDTSKGRDQFFFVSELIGEAIDSSGKPKVSLNAIVIVKEIINPLLKTTLPKVLKKMNQVIQKEIGEGTGKEGVDLEFFVSKVIANSVAVLLLGPELEKDNELIELLRDYANKIDATLRKGVMWHLIPFFGSSIVRYMIKKDNPSVKERKFIYDRIEKYIESRRKRIKNGEELEAGGVVDALSDKGYTINQIAQAIMVLGFASISTTTRNATCLISDLLAFPEYFKILREEQKKIIETAEKDETGSPLLTKQEIDQFEYLNSTIRETLRHRANHLEAWRYTEVDRVLPNGMKIPKGTIMALDLPNIHFNPEVYGSKEINSKTRDNSLPLELQYNPFQFVKPKVKATRVTQDFLNFGMGKHACPGRFFAVQEITSLVCTLLQKYRIETKDNEKMPFYTGDFKIPMPNVVFKPLV